MSKTRKIRRNPRRRKTIKSKKSKNKTPRFVDLFNDKHILTSSEKKQINGNRITKDLIGSVQKDLRKYGILMNVRPLHITNGYYIQDMAWIGVGKEPYLVPILKFDEEKRLVIPKEGVAVQHQGITTHRKHVMDTLKKYFKNVKWSGKEKDAIMIKG